MSSMGTPTSSAYLRKCPLAKTWRAQLIKVICFQRTNFRFVEMQLLRDVPHRNIIAPPRDSKPLTAYRLVRRRFRFS